MQSLTRLRVRLMVFWLASILLGSTPDAYRSSQRIMHPSSAQAKVQIQSLLPRQTLFKTSLLAVGKPLAEILFGWDDENSPALDDLAALSTLKRLSQDSNHDSDDDDDNASDSDVISEEDMTFINTYVLNDEHDKMLSKKVSAAIEEQWDVMQGVMGPPRRKALPIKANLDLWTYEARRELTKGNFTGSEAIYRKCIDYNPCDGRAWLGLARVQWKTGKGDLAEKSFKDGLYYDPKNPYLMQAWAVQLVKQGKTKQAMTLLTAAVKKSPGHAASWVEMARIHQRSGDVISARYCFQQAAESDKRSYVALQAWGVLELELGNTAKARELLERAISISPSSVHSLQALATLEKREGNLEGAQKLLEEAIRVFPGATRAMAALAEVFEMRGEVKEARRVFRMGQGRAEACGDAGFFQSWAMLELRCTYETNSTLDRVDDIRDIFKRAVKVNKFHSASWTAWAKFEQKVGNPEVARKVLIAGISKFPNSKNIGWFHSALGHLARQSGDINTARACYSRALAATPLQSAIPVLLEYIRMETFHGGLKEAKELLELGVTRYPTDDRVWTAYEEYLKRDSAAGPLRSKLVHGQGKDQGSSSAHTARAIEELWGRKAEAVAAATRSSSNKGSDKQYYSNDGR